MPSPSRTDAGGALPPAAVALMLLLCGVWGLNLVAMKVTSAGIPPVLQAGLRSVVAAGLVPLLCRPLGLTFGEWRQPRLLLPGIAAGLLFAVEFIALYVGIGLTTASRGVVFLYGAPFWVALGTHWLVPGDRLTRAKALGLCVAFGGLVLAFAEGLRAPGGPDMLAGDLLCLIGGALWAATTVLVKASPLREASPAFVLQVQLVVSAPPLLLASALLGEPWAIDPQPLVLATFLYQAAGIAGASYLTWFWLVSRHSASRLAAFSVLTPIFGVAAGALLLGEPLGGGFLASVALVALGLWLVNRPAG
ncbi:DMT family transporter [Paracraurococcus lichenis]|uniref:DMT family transporter n=1 Tax=Paracraurococcus lichenis TaxID=3064888 RepID=A0ABT9DWV4_9PROT|nr:DMT family transporter [Paracraurococcus sp. LOR1-02]MDO9708383.1 DMT family transporter [Paracraurococcus sp. LOR1-02]